MISLIIIYYFFNHWHSDYSGIFFKKVVRWTGSLGADFVMHRLLIAALCKLC